MSDAGLQLLSALQSTLRLATPLILAALGGLFSERAGVIALGLEGFMLGGAFAAASVAYLSGSLWLGLAAAMAAAAALALVHGVASITYRGNQVVSGIALNLIVAGLAPTLGTAWFHENGNTPALPNSARFLPLDIPGDRPFLTVLRGHTVLVYAAFLAVPIVARVLSSTRFGLRLRAAGENPEAVGNAGISVARLRYLGVLWSGVLCGAAGAYLALAQGAGFLRDMTAGRGYLALVALIFGGWRPVPTMFACLLFAFADAVQTRLQGVALPGVGRVPVQFVEMAPYVVTVLVLAGFVGRARPPKAIGQPHVQSR